MTTAFLTALHSSSILLMDGAMGTELQRLTKKASFEGYDQFNLTHPDLIRSVHRAYTEAGARVLLTNTFQCHQPEVWQAALRLAREIANEEIFLLADVGPVEKMTDSLARTIVSQCHQADGMLLETWSSLDGLRQFSKAHRADAQAPPLLVSFTFHRDARELTTFEGVRPEECARVACEVGAVAIGANCGKDIDMRDMAELVKRYRSVCDLPLFVRPNAGTPTPTETGWIWPHNAQEMANELPDVLQAGASMVGGCCGTTPEYIRAFRDVVETCRLRLTEKR